MMRRGIIAIFALAFLAGCAQPTVKHFPEGKQLSQYKVMTWQHWDQLGDRVVQDMVASLQSVPELDAASGAIEDELYQRSLLGGRPFYVQGLASDMPFSSAFKGILQQNLLDHNMAVSSSPEQSIVVNYRVQPFFYDERSQKYPATSTVLWSVAAGLGLSAFDAVPLEAAIVGGFAAGPIITSLIDYGAVTDAEVVVTTSILYGDAVLYQNSEAVYIKPADLPLYMTQHPGLAAPRPTEPRITERMQVQRVPVVSE
ncbi:hypothetical protein [Pelagibius sp. Alg239-R121]|uniref:hypothetical protein n=1 Tax=Pelagibius sp. Alg239-R121 TaxID=2993448 RepID=UPI0024A6C078|nr:hypothetical protein [Pelagibius sp. Alg239-R121]